MKLRNLSILLKSCLAVFFVTTTFAFSPVIVKAATSYDYNITSISEFNTFVSEVGIINGGYNLTSLHGTQGTGTSESGADKNGDGLVAVRFSTNIALDKPLIVGTVDTVITVDSGCVLSVGASGQAIRVPSSYSNSSVTINGGGTIDGKAKTATNIFETSSSMAVSVSNVTLKDADNRALSITNCNNVAVSAVTVSGCGEHGIRLERCSGIISKSVVSGCSSNGIQSDTCGTLSVVGTTLSGNNGYGFYANSNTGITTVTDVTTSANKGASGVGIYSCFTTNISGGSSSNNTQCGYYISNTVATIADVTASSNKETGIIVTGSKKYKLSGITAEMNTLNGVSAVGGAELVMENSTISGNKNYGIQISDKASLIASNSASTKLTIANNNYSGISVTGSGSEITVNRALITGNGVNPKKSSAGAVGHGVGISESAYGKITNCTITGNHECAISLYDKGSARINGNNLSNNGRHGIGTGANVTLKSVQNNIINGNSYNGILLSSSKATDIKGNTISSNGNLGISLVSSIATVNENTVTKNKSHNISLSKNKKTDTCMLTLGQKNTISYSQNGHGIAVADGSVLQMASKNNADNKIENNKKNGISVTAKWASSKYTTKVELPVKISIYKNGQNGIYAKGNVSVSVVKASIKKNGKYGIGAEYDKSTKTGAYVAAHKCTIAGTSKSYGINASGDKVKVKLTNNTISAFANVGIMINGKATASAITGNNIICDNKNETGIMVKAKSTATKISSNTISGKKKYGIASYQSNTATKSDLKKNNIFRGNGTKVYYEK